MNKLVDQYNNNNCHQYIDKKPINADYSVLIKNFETNLKARKIKVNDRVTINKYENIFNKGYTKNWSTEIFITDSVLKNHPWTYGTKDINGEKKIIRDFYKKELLQSKL